MAADFQAGTITRISLKNFVTYDEVVVKPGKNLNLIIGANGTGKSTIVSAIVLGLGGNPKVIGRATQVGHYVKAGQKNATISIDLQNGPNKYVTVTRSFDVENRSHWMVNNKAVSNRQITELMNGFNIQVDNLCQFLPQDKVQEFSNLSSYDLLTETERSVGDPKLLENHRKLKDLRTQQAELEKELASHTRLQNKEKQTYDSLKDSVGQIQEQKTIKKRLKSLKQKKAWIIYQNKREGFDRAKKEKDEAEAKMKKIQKKLNPILQEITKFKSSINALEKTTKQHNTETAARIVKLNKFLEEIENFEKTINDLEKKCDYEIIEEQERDEHITEMKNQLNKMENDLTALINSYGTDEQLRIKIDEVTAKANEHKRNLNDIQMQQQFVNNEIEHINRKIRGEEINLQEIQNVENKRLEMLRKLSDDAYRGVVWLRSNQHLFSKPVHEPILLQINLKDPKYSLYFENIISHRDLVAFVCEDKNDMNLLLKYLRGQQNLNINAVHSDPNKEIDYRPHIPLQHIQQYGFEHYLISLIEAPKTILNFLVTMYGINNIPIGSDKVASNVENIPDSIRRFFSTSNSYVVNTSKYSKEKSTRQVAIFARGTLAITIDAEKIAFIKNQIINLNEKIKEFNKKLGEFKESSATVHAKFEANKETRINLQKNLDNIKNLKIRINVNNTKILETQNNRRSIDDIQSQYQAEIQAAILNQLEVYRKYNKMLDCYKNMIVYEEAKVELKCKKNELATKENSCQDLKEELSNAERDFKTLERELTPLKNDLKALYDSAREMTGGLSYNDKEFEPIKKAFAKLPASLEALFEEIQTTQAKIFCLNNDQQEANRVLELFNLTKKKLDKLNEVITAKDGELATITQEINLIRNEWLPMLENLVEKINNNFSNYFHKMKCAGEVSLEIPNNEMDFEKYGLRIRVKFRDADELQILTRNHQSGGERAVTTAVYMIALQELTIVPFRCVDEINQGMDATNERRVFELIVNITSKSNSSQYFMLTPKLLPNLQYNESVTVLTVFNGKFMIPCSELDMHSKCHEIIKAVSRRRSDITV